MKQEINGETAPEGEKMTKLVRVQQGYIDRLLNRSPRGPYPDMSDEAIDRLFRPENREHYRRLQAEIVAIIKKMHDEEDDILHQYNTKGFAMQEIEIGDEDKDEDGEDAHDI